MLEQIGIVICSHLRSYMGMGVACMEIVPDARTNWYRYLLTFTFLYGDGGGMYGDCTRCSNKLVSLSAHIYVPIWGWGWHVWRLYPMLEQIGIVICSHLRSYMGVGVACMEIVPDARTNWYRYLLTFTFLYGGGGGMYGDCTRCSN